MKNQILNRKQIRPTTGQIAPKSISESHRQSQQNNYDPFNSASTSVSDATDEIGSIGNELDSKLYRAQKVHQTQKLDPAFKKNSTQHAQFSDIGNAVPRKDMQKVSYDHADCPKINNQKHIRGLQLNQQTAASQINTTNQPMIKKLSLEPSDSQKMADEKTSKGRSKSPKNQQAQLAVERQIKYLGLVIEKDDEHYYLLRKNDFNKYEESYKCPYEDNVQRQYYPIRDDYIRIVKNSRKVFIESLERKGQTNMKQTAKRISNKSKKIRNSFLKASQQSY